MDNEELRNIWIKGLEKKDSEKAPESEDLVSIWEKVTNKISDIQNSTPYPKYVKEKLDSFGNINDKIKFLQLVIARWEVNASTFILEQNLTGWDKEVVEDSKNRHIELYTKWLDYLKIKKEMQEETDNIADLGTDIANENNNPRSMKVTTDVLVEILEKANINVANSDKTKIAQLISYLTGYSYNTIRARLTNKEELTSKHKVEADNINKILNELNTGISVKYNKNR